MHTKYNDPFLQYIQNVLHVVFQAHAKAWHTYDTQFRPTQRGEVSVVLGSHWVLPQRTPASQADVELCQRSMESVLGWFANPIFRDGDYPASMRSQHGDLLPTFTPEEKAWVQGTADFFALSFGPNDLRLGRSLVPYGQSVSPDLRSVLRWIRLEYGDRRVLVAEGGWFSEAAVGTEDTVAIYLMKRFINQVLQGERLTDGARCKRNRTGLRSKGTLHMSCFTFQPSGLTACRCSATPPGLWWTASSGTTATV